MKKQILLVVMFFVFSVLSTTVTGQQGNALLKIVKSEDGTVKVYDMQGSEIHQSKAETTANEGANETMSPGAFQSQEIHQVVLDPADPEAQKELQRLELQQAGNIVTGEGALPVEEQKVFEPVPVESVGIIPSNWENAEAENDLQAIEQVKESIAAAPANPGPDLTYSSGSWNYYTYTAPNLTIYIRIINNGTTTAGGSYVGYYLSTDNTITTGDHFLGSDYVAALNPGSYSNENITVNLCRVTPALLSGTYYVGIYADYRNQVAEDNENNNGGYYSTKMTWSTSVCPLPNLTCYTGSAYNYYSFNTSTCALSYTIRIKNSSTTTAAGASYVAYYLSTDANITTSDTRIGSDYVASLAPGGYSNESISISNVGSFVPPGTYYVGFYIDYDNRVQESNETDNNWYTPPSFTTNCACANLTAQGQPASYNYNSSTHALTINVRIINSGSCAALSSSTLGYYLSSNTTITTSDSKLGTDSVPALGAGSYSNEGITIPDICTIITNGTWYVGFIIDETNKVAETSESDNNWYFSPAIGVLCTACANLTSQGQPASFNYNSSNCQLDINVRVINNGTCAAASTSTLGYYLSADTDIKTDDCKLGSDTLPNLDAGAHSDQVFSIPDICIKACVATGTWYVGFIIDDANVVPESNENDNSWHFTPSIAVTCPCGGGGCSIKVTSPDGGEVWDVNTVHPITWNLTGTCSNVKIEYSLTGAAPWTVITSSTPNDGSFDWTLPDVGSTETNCKVRISCTDGTCSDVSNNPFTIKGTGCPLRVLVPNSRVAWKAGMSYKISWVPAGKSGNVKIEYSPDNGGSWNTIEGSTPDVGCYCWSIPAEVSSNQMLIKISDVGDPSCEDMSDVVFTVGPPVAPFLLATDIMGAPGGGNVVSEILIGGNTNPIDAISMSLYYDTDHLSFVEAKNVDLTTGWIFDGNEITPGEIKIGGLNPSGGPIAIGSSGVIAQVIFKITCPSCDDCSQSHLIPADLIEDLASMNSYSGTYTHTGCCECGDVNMNGVISSEDALCAFRIYLAGGVLPPDHPECHTECSLTAADVNANGMVTSEDALGIFKYYLNGFWDPGFCGAGLYKKQKQSYNLILDNVYGQQGDIVKVPIRVDNPKGLAAFGLELEYPANLLEYIGTGKTSLTKEWTALDGKENRAGLITLGGFHTDAIGVTTTAAIAQVSFRVKKGADGEGKLNIFNLTDDLGESFYTEGSFSTNVSQMTPTAFKLSQNYPNPFNMETRIEYHLPEASQVRVNIYNVSGQKIRTLVDSNIEAGIHNVVWNGRNDAGKTMASGIYICKLETGNRILSIKMLLMK